MSAQPPSDDDLDRRFAELVGREFPDDRPTHMGRRPRRRRVEATPQAQPDRELLTPFDRLDAADDEEWQRGDNRYRPRPLPPMRPWSTPTKLGTALMGLSVLLTLLITFGVPFPGWVNTVAMVAFVVGLATLLFRLVQSGGPTRHDGDDGARV